MGCCRRLCFRLLWPWPLTFWPENLISISPSSDTYVTWFQVKLAPLWADIAFTRFSRLWHWPLIFWPQNLISTSMNPRTYVTKIGWNSLHWFLRYGVHKVFRDAQTHSRTDEPEYKMPPAPFFNGGVGIKPYGVAPIVAIRATTTGHPSADKISWRLVQRFQRYARGQTDKCTDRRADHNTPHPYYGGVTTITIIAQTRFPPFLPREHISGTAGPIFTKFCLRMDAL